MHLLSMPRARLYSVHVRTRLDPTRIRTFKIPYGVQPARAASNLDSKTPFEYRTRVYSRYSRAAVDFSWSSSAQRDRSPLEQIWSYGDFQYIIH